MLVCETCFCCFLVGEGRGWGADNRLYSLQRVSAPVHLSTELTLVGFCDDDVHCRRVTHVW